MRKIINHYLKSFLLLDLLKGLMITVKYFFKRKVTLNYPEEKTPVSPRFRGIHALRSYPNGEERCIACKLCEAVCPALAINITAEQREDGMRRAKVYEIDLFKCVFCGLCEEACPVDAIVLTNMHNYHHRQRGDQILTKEKLLAIGEHYAADIDKKLLEAEL